MSSGARCSSCGGTVKPLRRNSRNAIACNNCFRHWKFLGETSKKEMLEWELIDSQDKQLTKRQSEVLEGIARGRNFKEIASVLGIDRKSVGYHWEAIRQKMKFTSIIEATHWALAKGVVENIYK